MSFAEKIVLSKSDLNNLDINSMENFNALLKNERNRCDRINKEFCLVVFNIIDNDEFLITAWNLVNLLKSKTRNYDEIGWADQHHIALLLPEISMKKAKKVAERIIINLEKKYQVTDYKISSYPSLIKENESNDNTDLNLQITDGYDMPLWKRAFDIVVSFSALSVMSPVLLMTAALIKIVSPGPVFFKQKRVGLSGKIFYLLKLRTMKVNNDDSSHREHLVKFVNYESNSELPMNNFEDDNRIIMFGKIIRKTCIDEIPQFINVLKGDMSIVGPRSFSPYEAEEVLHFNKRRFNIVPGITGLWQVSGKNNTTFQEMIQLDIEYADKISFLLDLKIIFKTPAVIIGHFFDRIKKRLIVNSRN